MTTLVGLRVGKEFLETLIIALLREQTSALFSLMALACERSIEEEISTFYFNLMENTRLWLYLLGERVMLLYMIYPAAWC
jgi:hypothetical protein